MRYRVIDAANVGELTLLVNSAVGDGWRPQGGVCVSVLRDEDGPTPHFYQAVVKAGTQDPLVYAVAEVAEELGGLPPAPPDAN